MSETGTFFVVTTGGGKCLTNTQTAQGVLDCLHIEGDDKKQKWILETGDNEKIVAFRSVIDGQYLVNLNSNIVTGAKIGLGEKQWWTLEKGRTPGSCLIRSNACTVGKSYLNDFQGVYRDNNYVHMWHMEKPLEFWLTWYFVDAGKEVFTPMSLSSSDGSQAKNSPQVEQDVMAKRTADIEKREAALRKQQQDLATREEELRRRQQNEATQPVPQKSSQSPGYQMYPPPRKLEKQVVGFLYEDQGLPAQQRTIFVKE